MADTNLRRLQSTRLADQAYQEIRLAIRSGQFAPGASLGEVELAAALGISRTPVREALARLRADGLIATTPGGGQAVRVLTDDEVTELFLVRETLECLSVREFLRRDPSRQTLASLQAILREQRTAAGDGDIAAFLAADEEFHVAVAQSAGLPEVARLLVSLRDKVRQAGLGAVTQADRTSVVLKEHESILTALRGGDERRATQAVQHHLGASLAAVRAGRSSTLATATH